MPVKVIANFGVLMQYAHALGQARMACISNPDDEQLKEEFEQAQKKHDEYRDICLSADEMSIGSTYSGIGF